MRLICPNCDAQYEVPDDAIPEAGRDVQCSDCGHTWFQTAATSKQQPEIERKPVPPEVASILREEAERERIAREQDRTSIEVQDEIPLSEPEPELPSHPFVEPQSDEPEETEDDRRAREARERMSRLRGYSLQENEQADQEASASRRDLLPDIDTINSTLVSNEGPETYSHEYDVEAINKRENRAAGFRTGFSAVIVVGIFAAVSYLFAEELARAVPSLEPVLIEYVTSVDQARLWLDVQAKDILARINQITSG